MSSCNSFSTSRSNLYGPFQPAAPTQPTLPIGSPVESTELKLERAMAAAALAVLPELKAALHADASRVQRQRHEVMRRMFETHSFTTDCFILKAVFAAWSGGWQKYAKVRALLNNRGDQAWEQRALEAEQRATVAERRLVELEERLRELEPSETSTVAIKPSTQANLSGPVAPGLLPPGKVLSSVGGTGGTESPTESPGVYQAPVARPPLDPEEGKGSVKAHFIQCFKDDLYQERQLLMSQINNLFKLRNRGDPLQYKDVGYEKLHDFLLDMPGLALVGAGNQMEVKISNRATFEAFVDEVLAGNHDIPSFDRPQPVPESFQWKVIEVFRRAGSREIPAKSFRDLWNCFFPQEKLQCKDFGYRDVKGLLANIPIVEKVGGKSNTKYVLRADIDIFTGPAPQPVQRPSPPGILSSNDSVNFASLSNLAPQALPMPPAPTAPPPPRPVAVREAPGLSDYLIAPTESLTSHKIAPGLGDYLTLDQMAPTESLKNHTLDYHYEATLPAPSWQDTNPITVSPKPGIEQCVDEVGLLEPLNSASLAYEERKRNKLQKPKKAASFFASSPGALSTEGTMFGHQNRFDTGSLYQAQLRTDKSCMIVDFSNGRIQFSNAPCDKLFSTLFPLPQREVLEIIADQDRITFSTTVLYLSVGKFSVLDRHRVHIITGKGVVPALLGGEQLVGSLWWLDCEVIEE
jgi:hypothetical protein